MHPAQECVRRRANHAVAECVTDMDTGMRAARFADDNHDGVSDPSGLRLRRKSGVREGGSLTPNLLHLSDINQRHRGRRRDSRERPRYCGRTTYSGPSSAASAIDCAATVYAGGNTAPQGAFPPVFPLRPEGNAYQSQVGRRSNPRTIHSPSDRRSIPIVPRPPR